MKKSRRSEKKPTTEQLRKLYEEATEFKKLQPWKWLYDMDLICVENPKDGTVGYCSVMGRGGDHYALGVYLGDKGLMGFIEVLDQEGIPNHQVMHYQDCLMASFEDRVLLSPQDRKEIKSLGLSFRGRNAWPVFRRHEEGYHPWYINEEECVFLTHALEQTRFVATRVKEGKLPMDMERGQTILRRSKGQGEHLEWESVKIQLDIPHREYQPLIIEDEMLIKKLKNAKSLGGGHLEVDCCFLPGMIQKKRTDRPYYPKAFLIADHETGMILKFETYGSKEEDVNMTMNTMIQFCLEIGVPKKIIVRSAFMQNVLSDFCRISGIEIQLSTRLPAIDEMMEAMSRDFNG